MDFDSALAGCGGVIYIAKKKARHVVKEVAFGEEYLRSHVVIVETSIP